MTDLLTAGDFSVDLDARTVRGLLLPFGEASRLSANGVPPITFSADSIKLPRDVSVISANREHNRHDPVGRATAIETTPNGLVATFAVADTDEGDEFLAQYRSGTKRKLSAEVADIVRNGSAAVSARLTGAAFVTEGAFASAALFALGDVTETLTDEGTAPLAVPENGTVEIVTETVPERIDVTTADSETPTSFIPETETEAADVATATAPTNLDAAASIVATDKTSVFDAIRSVQSGVNSVEAEQLLAALADIKTTGLGANAIQPAWLGNVWTDRSYTRKYWGLVKNGNIVAQTEKGFLLDDAAPIIAKWAGNKAEVPTGNGTTSPVTGTFQRWAAAVDIAREFFDLSDGGPVIDAFVARFIDDYAKLTDEWALDQFYAAAGAQVDADADYPTEYNASIAKLIDGIDAVNDSDVDATFVVVAPDVHRELLFTPKDKIPEFVTFGANTHGEGTADGVQIIRDKFGVLEAGQLLFGSHDAAHLNELAGGSPIQVDAQDLARGGLDKAVYGYTQYMTEYAKGFLLLGDAA